MPEPLGTTAGRWVLLSYRMPREPSTPRVEVGRALRRLGVVQLLDGLVALPEDSRTREQFEWIADQVLEAGGEAAIWLSVPATRAQERALAERMRAAVAGDYRLLSGQAEDALDAEPVARRRALRRLRRQMRALRRRDYFPPAERELVSGLALVKAVFRGVGPAVLAIVAIAAVKLARSTNERDPVLWAIAGVLCAVTAIAGAESVWMFLLAGAFGAVYYGGGLPRVRAAASVSPLGLLAAVQGFAWTGSGASLGALAVFFAKAGRSRSARAWRSCRSCIRGSWPITAG